MLVIRESTNCRTWVRRDNSSPVVPRNDNHKVFSTPDFLLYRVPKHGTSNRTVGQRYPVFIAEVNEIVVFFKCRGKLDRRFFKVKNDRVVSSFREEQRTSLSAYSWRNFLEASFALVSLISTACDTTSIDRIVATMNFILDFNFLFFC